MTSNAETLLARIADALERLAPPRATPPSWPDAEAFLWTAGTLSLTPVPAI